MGGPGKILGAQWPPWHPPSSALVRSNLCSLCKEVCGCKATGYAEWIKQTICKSSHKSKTGNYNTLSMRAWVWTCISASTGTSCAMSLLLQPLRWCCIDCVIHHERDMREEQHHRYMWREQAIIEWSWHVNSIVACCHSAKLCAYAARDFRSQHFKESVFHLMLQNNVAPNIGQNCQVISGL